MAIITERAKSLEIFARAEKCRMSVAIFCTASHWNTEAILLAADILAKKHGLEDVPLVVATTFTYRHMPQARRFTYAGDARSGFLAHMGNLQALASGKYAPYRHINVLPHLDHAHPERDRWALTAGLPYLSSVMFDAQEYSLQKNLLLTGEYVRNFGDQVLVEGIIESLNVEGGAVSSRVTDYCRQAEAFVAKTKVDFLVADLGTEQQSSATGGASYDQKRAAELTRALGRSMLVLHGTSCLDGEQVRGLAADGIIRVNMWTRIAREAGQYAAENLLGRISEIRRGNFDAAEANMYIRDNIEKAAAIMVEMMELYGYANWR